MNFNRTIWSNLSFSVRRPIPNWPCPICLNGVLQKDGESIKTFENKSNKQIESAESLEGSLAPFRFSGYLICNACKERVMIVGHGRYNASSTDSEVSPAYEGKKYLVFFPEHFVPTLPLFSLPRALSHEARSLLVLSFHHFWYDLDACANKIRQALEVIMKEHGGDGKDLHHKIESLKNEFDGTIYKMLMSLKHIGNDGSHAAQPFVREEFLKSYEVLETVLNRLYPDAEMQDRLDQFVATVNANKGLKK